MATTLFLRETSIQTPSSPPDLASDLNPSRGSSAVGSQQTSTVAGPTSGVQITNGALRSWWYRVNAVTISGAITKNFWMSENNMSANVGAQSIIDRCDSTGAFISTVENSEKGTELVVTTQTAENWATGTVTSTTFAAGDYIRVRVLGNDVGTMASGFFFFTNWDGPTGGSDGDSFVTFTETITAYTPAADKPHVNVYPPLLAQ